MIKQTDAFKMCVNIFVSLLATYIAIAQCQNTSEKTNESYVVLTIYNNTKVVPNCALELDHSSTKEDVIQLAEEDVRQIKYKFNVKEDKGPFSTGKRHDTLLVHPYDFVLAAEGSGKALLMLQPYFQPMSLFTLGYGVTEVKVNLVQNPLNCLENVTAKSLEHKLKLLILKNFGNVTSTYLSEKSVCNQHIGVADSDIGIVKYSCCKLDSENHLMCNDLTETTWVYLLFTIITILQIVFVLYSPTFVPGGGRMGVKFIDYIYKPQTPLKLNIVTVDSNKVISDQRFIKTRQFSFIHLTNLKEKIRSIPDGILHTIFLKEIHLSVRASKLVPDGYTPVSFFRFIRKFFVRCHIRKDLPALKNCCNANMFKTFGCIEVSWVIFLTLLMRGVLVFLFILPWLARVWFYYTFEKNDRQIIRMQLEKHGLQQSYQSSLVVYLTPEHPLFIFIYVTITINASVYIFLPPVAKRKLKYTIQMSLKAMNSTRKFDSVISFIAHLLYPLEEFGIVGLLILPLWLLVLPFGMMILGYLLFPIINLTVRLFVNFIYYTVKFIKPDLHKTFSFNNRILRRLCTKISKWADDIIIVDKFEPRSRKNMMTHVVSLTMCMVTTFALLVLVVQCISFFVECAIYIIIGIILNSKDVMKYISLLVLIIWYAIDCFSAVSNRYSSFGKTINSEIQERVGDAVKAVAMCAKQDQKEQAFIVQENTADNDTRISLVAGTEGYLKWNAKRLLLFLDRDDIPYIPKDFLFKSAKLGHFGCPGPVYMMYFKALIELIWITMFLAFVMLVILAFGEANNISGANQTLATLASGFLPFVFRKFLIKPHSGPSLDKGNITWQTTLSEAIERYTKRWTITDFELMTCESTDNLNASDSTTYKPKIINLTPTVPDNVDLIVKIRKGVNGEEEMEFWARKIVEQKSSTKYIWTETQKDGQPIAIDVTEI